MDGKSYTDGEDTESAILIDSHSDDQNWIYRVNKSSSIWILTVQYPYTIMHHSSPLFYPCVEYYLLPNSQQLEIRPGQWCEMIYNGSWSLMSDADHR